MNFLRTNRHEHQVPHSKGFLLLWDIFRFLAIFLVFFVFTSAIIMWPTIYARFTYRAGGSHSEAVAKKYGLDPSGATLPAISERKPYISPEPRIIIPKIGVDAPLVFPKAADNASILEAIEEGAALYPGTALPGRLGNTFITAHSSYYWWSGGEYNNLFALLDQLKKGDLIYLHYRGEEFIYRVRNSLVIKPTQVDVLNPTKTATISLMTCVPLGTNLKRLIVQGDLVSPAPKSGLEQVRLPSAPSILPLY